MQLIADIFYCFELNPEDWKLVPGSFIILMKWGYHEISYFIIIDIYCLSWLKIHTFKIVKIKTCHTW